MGSQSNPTVRAVKLLNFFSANPCESFGLSELARRLCINKATCLAVVRTLVSYGYLVQNEQTKAYALGPTLAAVGSAAHERFPAVDYANEVLKKLSRESNSGALASVLTGEQELVIGRYGILPDTHISASRVGLTVPFTPPFGACFVAWMPSDEEARWLEKGRGNTHSLHRELVESIRKRGYEIYRYSELTYRLQQAIDNADAAPESKAAGDEVTDAMQAMINSDYFIREVNDDELYPVMGISVPVLNAESRTEMVLSTYGFHGRLTGREIYQKIDILMAAAEEMTGAINGYMPNYETRPVATF